MTPCAHAPAPDLGPVALRARARRTKRVPAGEVESAGVLWWRWRRMVDKLNKALAAAEKKKALDEIHKIAALRLHDVLWAS